MRPKPKIKLHGKRKKPAERLYSNWNVLSKEEFREKWNQYINPIAIINIPFDKTNDFKAI